MKLSTVSLFKNIKCNDEHMITLDEEQLKHLQKVILSITEDVLGVCEENHINYHLGGGSCLGAIRHQGIIPWDDDIDINMTRRSFKKFLPLFREKFGDKYWIHIPWETENYGMTFVRIRLKNSRFRGREDFHTGECGIFIDLFLIENTYDNAILRYLQGMASLACGFLLSCRNFYENRKELLALVDGNSEAEKIFRIKIAIGRLTSVMSVDWWTRLTDRCYSMCKNGKSQYVSVPAGRNHFFGELYARKEFVRTRRAPFEGHRWRVPVNAEAYLKHMYGNYMEIPPESGREKHVLCELRFPDETAADK